MKSYGIESANLTMLGMMRWNLVTKEKVKQAYEGKLKNDKDWKMYKESIHDDLENFFANLQGQTKINEHVYSFYTPKLSVDELKLVERKDELHLGTYSWHNFKRNPDVDDEEMKKSNSKSKYVKGHCWRHTIHLVTESNRRRATDENYSDQEVKRQKL